MSSTTEMRLFVDAMAECDSVPVTLTMREFFELATGVNPMPLNGCDVVSHEKSEQYVHLREVQRHIPVDDESPHSAVDADDDEVAQFDEAKLRRAANAESKSSCCRDSEASDSASDASTDAGSDMPPERIDRSLTWQSSLSSGGRRCEEQPRRLTRELLSGRPGGLSSYEQLQMGRLSAVAGCRLQLTSENLALLQESHSGETGRAWRITLIERYATQQRMMERLRLLFPASFPHCEEVHWLEPAATLVDKSEVTMLEGGQEIVKEEDEDEVDEHDQERQLAEEVEKSRCCQGLDSEPPTITMREFFNLARGEKAAKITERAADVVEDEVARPEEVELRPAANLWDSSSGSQDSEAPDSISEDSASEASMGFDSLPEGADRPHHRKPSPRLTRQLLSDVPGHLSSYEQLQTARLISLPQSNPSRPQLTRDNLFLLQEAYSDESVGAWRVALIERCARQHQPSASFPHFDEVDLDETIDSQQEAALELNTHSEHISE